MLKKISERLSRFPDSNSPDVFAFLLEDYLF